MFLGKSTEFLGRKTSLNGNQPTSLENLWPKIISGNPCSSSNFKWYCRYDTKSSDIEIQSTKPAEIISQPTNPFYSYHTILEHHWRVNSVRNIWSIMKDTVSRSTHFKTLSCVYCIARERKVIETSAFVNRYCMTNDTSVYEESALAWSVHVSLDWKCISRNP